MCGLCTDIKKTIPTPTIYNTHVRKQMFETNFAVVPVDIIRKAIKSKSMHLFDKAH